MDVETRLRCYEVNGKKTDGIEHPKLIVRSHWNQNDVNGLVVLETPEGEKYTVASGQLSRAISSCTGL